MKAVIFNHGFNRVENRQIINIERSKLNRLLNEERRIVEHLTKSAQTEIQIKLHVLESVEAIWRNVAEHRLVREIRRRIDCLTDAYPQFLRQVEAARSSLRKRFFALFNAIHFSSQSSIGRFRKSHPDL